MSALPKGVPLKGGLVKTFSGTPAPVLALPIAASQTVKIGDLLIPNSSTQLLEQAISSSSLTTAGYVIRADVTGRTFVAVEDKTSAASVTDVDKIRVVELTQDTAVQLCLMAAGTSAGAVASTNTTETATKIDTVYSVCRYTPDTTTFYYGLAPSAPTGNAGLKIRAYCPEKAIGETYGMVWATKPTADGL